MLSFFRFLLIFFIVVYALGLLFRLILRYTFHRMGKKYGGYGESRRGKTEGEVHVSRPPEKEKIVDKDVGEYVDYEEVKE